MQSINDPSKKVAIYVNGIENPKEYAEKTREMIEQQSGVTTELVYDPYGLKAPVEPDSWMTDEEQVIDQIRDKVRDEVAAGKQVVIIAHSYGAYLTLQALRELSTDTLKNVIFEGFGGVALVPNDMGLKKALNIRNSWDKIAELGGFLKEKSSWIKTWDEVENNERLQKEYSTEVLPDGSWNLFNQHAFRINYIKRAVDDLKAFKNTPVEDQSEGTSTAAAIGIALAILLEGFASYKFVLQRPLPIVSRFV